MMQPMPRAPPHVRAGSLLGRRIAAPYDDGVGGPGGWWILDEPELHLGSDILVPDLAGWQRRRMMRLPETAYFPLAPDWVCEILSPSTSALDRVQKLRVYAREGVAHAWLVDPDARTLEVLRLDGGRWTILAAHAGTDVVRAEPFADIELGLTSLWPDGPG
jgi:Uma2 family endonuclease